MLNVKGAFQPRIGDSAFYGCSSLTSVTIPSSVESIPCAAFFGCTSLTEVFCAGDAPSVDNPGWDSATIYYLPGTAGWSSTLGGRPTALRYRPKPVILNNPSGFGVPHNPFSFTIAWATSLSVVVEACTNLVPPRWVPVQTNTLGNGTSVFSDSEWTRYPRRFYRVRY